MAKRISIFDFLWMKHLTQAGDFSPSVDSGASVNHYKDLKLYFLVMSLWVESNELSKSGLGIEIGRFCVKIQLLSHHKTTKIATSWENRKNWNVEVFTFFHLTFHFKSFSTKINRNQSKNMQILKIEFFRFSHG